MKNRKIRTVGDLKRFLLNFPDKIEIKFYNGDVDDWHNVIVDEDELIKEKPSYTLDTINYYNEQHNIPKWSKLEKGKYKERDWEFINSFLMDEIDRHPEERKNYSFKKILLFQGERRNKSVYGGRYSGDISY